MKDVMIKCSNLTKIYGKNRVVDNLNIEVKKGDVFGFLGPNGAGKTTTIRMILGLIGKSQGTVLVKGYDIDKDFKKAIVHMGSVVETPTFYGYLSGYENLAQIARLYGNINKDKIYDILDFVGLKGRERDKVRKYSLGMKQRLGIARALLPSPEILILDEPTNGLDPQGMIEVRNLIKKLSKESGITCFVSTHLLHEVEQICNRVAIINHGRTLVEGGVEQLLHKDKDTVELITPDRDKAISLLGSFEGLTLDSTSKNIIVTGSKGVSSQIIATFAQNNVTLDYVIPRTETLENYFIQVTGGNNNV